MDRSEVMKKVDAVLVDDFEVEEDLLKPEVSLYEELDFDSLDAVDLIASLEREFTIKIDRLNAEKEIREIRTLEDIYAFVERKLAEPSE